MFEVTEGLILIKKPSGNAYEIEIARSDSMGKILAWVVHLSEMEWATKKILREIVEFACDTHALEIPRV